MRRLHPLLFAAILVPAGRLAAQAEPGLRAGAVLSAPSRVLNAGPGHVKFGFGVGAEAVWTRPFSPVASAVYHLRIVSASVQGEQAGNSWSPGRALVVDATVRLERSTSDRFTVFIGPGVSHWRGPDDTVPFAGVGGVLLGAEAGFTWRPTESTWRVVQATRWTRISADEERGVLSGFTFRWLLGVDRAF
jgi:hypothetical protein